jgi:uncharacterized protein YndB with AHSA1/START domain
METAPAVHNTFVIERTYPAAPAKVFAAFADPAKKRRWYAENPNHECESFEMDFRVGGVERARYRFGPKSPFPGAILANEGRLEDVAPDRRVVISSSMTLADRRVSTTLVTIELAPAADGGTTLTCTHQGVFYEGSDSPQMREGGWRALFDRLAAELAAS